MSSLPEAVPEAPPASAEAARPPAAAPPALVHRLLRTPSGAIGSALIVLIVLVAVLAPLLAPSSPTTIVGAPFEAPSGRHLLGTDNVGQDLLSNIVYGARVSLIVGTLAAVLALGVGALVGGLAGYFRGAADTILMRITELFQVIPALIFAIVVVALLGQRLSLLVAVIALTIWPQVARLVRAQFLTFRERDFVRAARVAGFPTRHIIVREILPNALPPVIVQVTLDVGTAILLEAGLSFLGLGDASVPSWGQILFNAQQYLQSAWWLSVFPGAAIAITVLAFNLFGDGLNAVLNPRARRRLEGGRSAGRLLRLAGRKRDGGER